MEAVDEVFTGKRKGYVYSRGANSTVDALRKKIASLEEESLVVLQHLVWELLVR